MKSRLEKIKDRLSKLLDKRGFVQRDRHLKRWTLSLPGHFVVIKGKDLNSAMMTESLPKYEKDSRRMRYSFDRCCSLAKKDEDSRQLMVFNDQDFYTNFQCFTHFQFVYTHRNEFDMYVYMRSSDLSKLKDDLVFFASVMKKFESKTRQKCTKLVIIFGHLHYETRKDTLRQRLK